MASTGVIAPDSPLVGALLAKGAERGQLREAAGDLPDSCQKCMSDRNLLSEILNTLFWLSLAKSEGRPVTLRVSVSSPATSYGYKLQNPVQFAIEELTRIAPAVGSNLLAIHCPENALQGWGILEIPPPLDCAIRIAGPGLIVVSRNRDVIGLLDSGRQHLVEGGPYSWMSMIAEALDHEIPFPDRMRHAAQLLGAVAQMHRHRHGGAIVIVPSKDDLWKKHVVLRHEFDPAQGQAIVRTRLQEATEYSKEMRELALKGGQPSLTSLELVARLEKSRLLGELAVSALRYLGDLTTVDGAVILGDDFSLYGFGARLLPDSMGIHLATFGAVNKELSTGVPLAAIGGTRHQSAAQFVYANWESMAFVSSQDGRLTLFAWVTKEQTVLAVQQLEHLIWEY